MMTATCTDASGLTFSKLFAWAVSRSCFRYSISRRSPGSGACIDESFRLLFGAAIHRMQGIFWSEFFDLNGQLVSRAGSRVAERHVCGDWHSIHQPHLILTKGLVLVGGPPQGCDEQRHDRHLDHEDSEFFQGGFSRWRGGSHTPLICRRSCRSPVFFPDFW